MSSPTAARSFREILRGRDSNLADQLVRMEEIANRVWIPFMKPDAGSHAGWIHLKNVERNADKMIPPAAKEQFSAGEIFLLLSAVLLHDVGRIAVSDMQCPLDRAPECTFLKRPEKLHPCWSSCLIQSHWYRFGLPDEHIAKYCALLSLWHGMQSRPDDATQCRHQKKTSEDFVVKSLEPYGSLRLPLLAAILRIADETENNWTRAIDPIWIDLQRDQSKELYKAFRRGVEDIEFCVPGRAVIYHVPHRELVSAEAGQQEPGLLRETANVLSLWGPFLQDAGVAYSRALISSGGEFYDSLANPGPGETPLARAFPVAKIEELWPRLKSLCLGTLGYEEYSWQALEAALAPPRGADLKWLLPLFATDRTGITIHATPERCSIQLPDSEQGLEKAAAALGVGGGTR